MSRSIILLTAALLPAFSALADPVEASIALADQRFALSRVAPDQPSAEVDFMVDDGDLVEVDAVSTLDGLVTSIVAPSGQVIDETTVAGVGGFFGAFQTTPSVSALTAELDQSGFHSRYRFPNLGAGTYRLLLTAPGVAEELAVLTSIRTSSTTATALVAPNPQVLLGSPVVLSALVFSGAQPVHGATVTVEIRDPNGVYTTLLLKDDGAGADDTSGDGIYSGALTPAVTGQFSAIASISGTTAAGLPFVRESGTQFQVVPPTGAFLGPFDDSGFDDDGDGFFDRVRLRPQVNTVVPGTYRVLATLRANGGNTVTRAGDAQLAAGHGVINVDFEADGLRTLGEDGPYAVESLDLFLIGAEGAQHADHVDNAGFTQAYKLSQLERPELALTGNFVEGGIDTDGNGQFDVLQVQLEVAVLRSGSYQWNARLTGSNLVELDFSFGGGFLNAGINQITFQYSGRKIGQSGLDGPFLVRDLLMFGNGASLVVDQAAVTRAYTSAQFEAGHSAVQCDAVKVGELIVQPSDDSHNANFLSAQPITVGQGGLLESVSMFVSSAAGNLRLGVYDASGPGGGPGSKLAESAAFAAIDGWNTAPVVAPLLLAPGIYWLSYLPDSDDLHTPVTRSSPAANVYSSFVFGPMPAAFPAAPTSEPGRWSLYATIVPVPNASAPVCGTLAVGEPQVQEIEDGNNANFLLAQPAELDTAATVESMSLFVQAASGNVRMGLYDASGPAGGPGAKLAETAELTAVEGWNTVPVTSPVRLPPGTYWLAYLPSSDELHTRGIRSGPTFNVYYHLPYGALPATFSATPTSEPGHWSVYATVTPLPH